MKFNTYSLILSLSLLGFFTAANAQEQPADSVDLYSLSLEELMNVPINSASKKDETLFDAPLSSYTITRADIDKAGSTSIMEALRLAPGVIVREQTNGVYDIHIRGFDNILRTSEDFTKSNLTTLVMIDNRPVFNHNLGGTFWEALPVDLNDVERIEIVRGPSAPLFGPNAVTGVINIITKRSNGDRKFYSNVNTQLGTPLTIVANGSFGIKFNSKINLTVSENYQKRERFEDTYYDASTDSYKKASDLFTNADKRYPHTKLALEKRGTNVFLSVTPTEKVLLDLSMGYQQSEIQKNFLGANNGSPFTTGKTNSLYANLSAKIHGFHIRTSATKGTDDLNLDAAPNKYDYTISDVTAEYDIHLGEKFSVVPGASYQHVNYDDSDYAKNGPSFLNGTSATITTTSGFLRTDSRPIKNLRIIAAIRGDKFSSPDKVYLAYEFATTYKLNEKNLIRAAVTKSNSGSFIGVNNLNLIVPLGPGMNFTRLGNQDVKLLTVQMIELGYRLQVTKSIQFDVDVFRQQATNFNAILTQTPLQQQFMNVPTTATQLGTTISLNFVPSEKIQFKPFVTIQKTQTEDLANAYADPKNYAITYSNSKHTNTPSFYGGYYFNFKASEHFSFNVNGYYYAAHRQYNSTDPNNLSKTGEIDGAFLLNAKATYSINKNFNVFINGRNALNTNARQVYAMDKIGGLYLAGLSFNLN